MLVKPAMLIVALCALPGVLHAEVFKCRSAQGKVEYSDSPCANAVPTGIENAPAPKGASEDANVRALGVYVREAIAKKEYDRASALAATQEHRDWIAAARAADAKVEAEERDRAVRAETLNEIRRGNDINARNAERLEELTEQQYRGGGYYRNPKPWCRTIVAGKVVYRRCR